ncbi:MAG: thioredoxin-disulfide reductase [Candidatus Micrarchaeia archaeon]
MVENLVIIGSGPAGLTAAIYSARELLKPLVITGEFGGQPTLTEIIENYPGFPEGIKGNELVERIKKQAEKFGARFLNEKVTKVDFSKVPFKIFIGEEVIEAKCVIIATGSRPRLLGIENENKFLGRGVSTCAICDAPLFVNKVVGVVGGGDTAIQYALTLSKFAKKVYLIHRRNEFRASKVEQEKVFKNPKIEIVFDSVVEKIIGETKVKGIVVKNLKTNQTKEIECDGLFLAIGEIPNSEIFNEIEKDENGYIKTTEEVKTNIPGVFVAGDVADRKYRQVITACASGAKAAIEAINFLKSMAQTNY